MLSSTETLLGLESSKDMMVLFNMFYVLSKAGHCASILRLDGPQEGMKP